MYSIYCSYAYIHVDMYICMFMNNGYYTGCILLDVTSTKLCVWAGAAEISPLIIARI